MQISVEMTENEIRQAISTYIKNVLNVPVRPEDVKIQVKSKQNYRSEWEEAAIKASFSSAVIATHEEGY